MRLAKVVMAVVLAAAPIASAQAGLALVDGINTSPNIDTGYWGGGYAYGFEYAPGSGYTFNRIEAQFGMTSGFPVTLAVYDGRNGPLLASGSATITQIQTWMAFDLNSPVTFTASHTYFIAVQPTNWPADLPGIMAGGPVELSWWYTAFMTLDFNNNAYLSSSPGFRFWMQYDSIPTLGMPGFVALGLLVALLGAAALVGRRLIG
jgi:hypothetical protein